ncbi:hypothetical protein BC831DRAFT_474226 [Entophlyctis helioformis]|nr:hypothetical protein BC831DRAFT_474226 [Entophlyctis helioformis]
MTTTLGLSDKQLEQFDRDGFLAVPDFFSLQEAAELKAAAARQLDAIDLSTHPKTRFVTGDDQGKKNDEYFLGSGDKVCSFFEVDAFDAEGRLVVDDKARAINKIGHALHDLDPVFKAFSVNDRIAAVMRSLSFKDPRVLQSMLIFKQPKIGGEVPPHQDSTFLYTDPPSAVGLWFAMEDCTLENGCMWFLPGSHKTIPIWKRMVRRADNMGTEFIHIDTPVADPPESAYVSVPVSAGTLVLIHGAVYHKSGHNYSAKSRWIYTFHCIEGDEAGHVYPANNWLQSPNKPFTKLYPVAQAQ